jgi:hypothetical protein
MMIFISCHCKILVLLKNLSSIQQIKFKALDVD